MPMQSLYSPLDPDALLTEAQTSDFLNLSIRTLQAWRMRNAGPKFVRAGRAIRYRRRDLTAWMDAHTMSSASASHSLPAGGVNTDIYQASGAGTHEV
jgi:hypothetical protein